MIAPEVEDLRAWVEAALARCGHVLTAGEALVARRVLGLEGEPARLYARLTARVPEVFALDTLDAAAVAELEAAELVDRLVPWSKRALASTVAELSQACARLGLDPRGRRPDLLSRLAGHVGFSDRAWIRVRHRGLVRRLGRLAELVRHPDRSRAVIERLGHVRWPEYAITPGPAPFRDRRDLLGWEQLADRELGVDEALAALDRPRWPPGRLDLRESIAEALLAAAREEERQGRTEAARALYLRLGGRIDAGELAVRVARTLEADGRLADAVAHLSAARVAADPVSRLAIGRAGRRIARAARLGWAPDPPLRPPVARDVPLVPAPLEGPRPGWEAGEGAATIEAAAVHLLAEHGRRALFGEGALWSTLFALLFAETWFLPVPGALPARFLSGPLDLGAPEFAARRREAVDEVLAAVARGKAAERVRAADARWRGVRLAGASWGVGTGEELASVAAAMSGEALGAVLRRLLDEGWRASRGLPDLAVLPGPAVTLASALPRRLGEGLVLVELKGPGDAVRDAQAVWHDRLARAGISIELWRVKRGSSTDRQDPLRR